MLPAVAGAAVVLAVMIEGFETVVLPRLITRPVRLTRYFYSSTWRAWSFTVCGAVPPGRRRETLLSLYGPLSLIVLLGIWAALMVLGFGLIYFSLGTGALKTFAGGGFPRCLYFSGTTFFTLGLGDVLPQAGAAKALTVLESGLGFGFLAVVISYLPALNQFFYRRETEISILGSRVGQPPSASEILDKHIAGGNLEVLRQLLYDWERWAAEVHESHLSYPVLAYFRSEHEEQSWVAALAAVLDSCAFVIAGVEGACKCQAELTFAMASHTAADLARVLRCPPEDPPIERLPPVELARLRAWISQKGLPLSGEKEMWERLAGLRPRYEPYLHALAVRFHLELPPWVRR